MSALPASIGSTSLGMSVAGYWVVGVRVHDHVGAQLQRRVEPGLEGRRQPLVVSETHEMFDAVAPRNLNGPVRRTVVDNEPLDPIEPGELPWQLGEDPRKRLFLVQAGDLDDQPHGP